MTEDRKPRSLGLPLFLLLALAASAAGTGQYYFLRHNLNAGLICYLIGVVAFVLLLVFQGPTEPSPVYEKKWFWGLALLILGAGCFVRLYKLDENPPGCWIDEAINGLDALEIIRTGKHHLYLTTMSAGRASLFVEVLTIPFRINPEPRVWVVRATAAVIGCLGLLFFLLLVRTAFSDRLALMATAFLAFSHWHTNYSRWGMEIIFSPTFDALTLWLLLAALKQGKRWLFLLAGLAFGLGIYGYYNHRIFAIGVIGFLVYLAIFQRESVKRHWVGLAIFLLSSFIVVLPEGIYALSHMDSFFDRAKQTVVWVGVENQPKLVYARLRNSLRRTLLAFQYEGDFNGRHNLPTASLLTFSPAVLLPLGMMVSLARCRKMEYILVLLWFCVGIVPAAITWEAPHASRLLETSGPCFIFAALALEQAWITLGKVWPRWGCKAAALLVLFALVTAAIADLRITFIIKPNDRRIFEAFSPMEALPGYRIKEIGESREVFLSDRLFGSPTTRFIALNVFNSDQHVIRHLNPLEDVPLKSVTGKDVSYLLDEEFAPFLPALRHVYPSGEEIVHRDKFGHAQFYEYRVSREEVADVAKQGAFSFPFGLECSFYADASGESKPFLTRVFPFLRAGFEYLLRSPSQLKLAVWRGSIIIPTTGAWRFIIHPSNTSLKIGDQLVISDKGEKASEGAHEGAIFLQEGEYPIEIRYIPRRDANFVQYREIPKFIWFRWTPPGQGTELVPSDKMRNSALPQVSYPQPSETVRPTLAMLNLKALELVPLQAWGGQGNGKGQFQEPRGIAIDVKNRVYVADTGNRRIQVFTGDGAFLAQWNRGDQPFVEPVAVVVNSKGEILVLDSGPCWIYRFSADGKYLDKFGGPEAQLYHPRGMAIDAKDAIYVADTGGARYLIFDANGVKGGSYGGIGGKAAGQFLDPSDIAVSPAGDVYAVDASNRRIQRLDLLGRYQGEWEIPAAAGYNVPHIVLADDGSLFVTAPGLGLIQRYASDGTLLGQWGEGMLRLPVNLALSGDRLYVTDTFNHRIQVFQVREKP